MKNIKIFATFFICLLVLSACSDDWKENALTAKFAFDKTTYYVGEEVSITNETMGGEGNYTCQWDLGDGKTSTEIAPKIISNLDFEDSFLLPPSRVPTGARDSTSGSFCRSGK